MKKVIAFAFFSVLLISSLSALEYRITVVNLTGFELTDIWVCRQGCEDWGDSYLHNPLPYRQSTTIILTDPESVKMEIHAQDVNGELYWIPLDLSAGNRFEITDLDLDLLYYYY